MLGARSPESFVSSFMNLKLKRKSKEVHMEVNKSRAGVRLQDVLTNLQCSLEGGDSLFQRCANVDSQKQWAGFA